MKSSTTYFLLTALVLPFLGLGLFLLVQRNYQSLPVLGPYEKIKGKEKLIQTPAWTLTNQNGKQFSSSQLTGNIQVLNFFFTSCPTICPAMNRNVQKVQQNFIADERVQFVSISVDPERDDPERLKEYEENYSLNKAQWHFLTGEKKKIYLLARKGYNLSATDADGESADIIHSQKVLLIDTDQQIRGIYDGTEAKDMATLIRDINRLLKESKK